MKEVVNQLIKEMKQEESGILDQDSDKLLVPRQESGRSKTIDAFGSKGHFDFDVKATTGDYGDMYRWVQEDGETYDRYLEEDLAGGRWEMSGQVEEYDAYFINPALIQDHWGKSSVAQRILQAVEKNIKWENLPNFLEGYNTWRSISPPRNIEQELEDIRQ